MNTIVTIYTIKCILCIDTTYSNIFSTTDVGCDRFLETRVLYIIR